MLTTYLRSVPGTGAITGAPSRTTRTAGLVLTKIFGGSAFSGTAVRAGLGPLEVGREPLERDDHVFLRHARPQRVEEPVGLTR